MYNPCEGRYLQSSQEVWSAVEEVVRKVVEEEGLASHQVKGLGFDATCSLVVVGEEEVEDGGRDIVMWMDHRAGEQAETINATKHKVAPFTLPTSHHLPSFWTTWEVQSPWRCSSPSCSG